MRRRGAEPKIESVRDLLLQAAHVALLESFCLDALLHIHTLALLLVAVLATTQAGVHILREVFLAGAAPLQDNWHSLEFRAPILLRLLESVRDLLLQAAHVALLEGVCLDALLHIHTLALLLVAVLATTQAGVHILREVFL